MTTTSRPIETDALPEVIARYLEAHQRRDLDAAIRSYAADATVIDEGRTYRGQDEIRAWLSRSASEYIYTIEVTGAAVFAADRYDVTHHLEGNFPGGHVDLRFRFTLRDGLMVRLVIEE